MMSVPSWRRPPERASPKLSRIMHRGLVCIGKMGLVVAMLKRRAGTRAVAASLTVSIDATGAEVSAIASGALATVADDPSPRRARQISALATRRQHASADGTRRRRDRVVNIRQHLTGSDDPSAGRDLNGCQDPVSPASSALAKLSPSLDRTSAFTRWRSSTWARVVSDWRMGCSAKNPCTSATASGVLRVFTGSTMRMIDGLGKVRLASSQLARTIFHARAPWLRLAMHRCNKYGAFWLRTSP